jgi:2-polyprenyl-6-methoxyphenol hydroxylase-like FAD-dependent oxidoreductase
MTEALIIGGGISGAVTAMALHKAGISSVVYEAYPTGAADAGAFLTIMHNGMDALRAIESHQPVIDNSFPANGIELVAANGEKVGERRFELDRVTSPAPSCAPACTRPCTKKPPGEASASSTASGLSPPRPCLPG